MDSQEGSVVVAAIVPAATAMEAAAAAAGEIMERSRKKKMDLLMLLDKSQLERLAQLVRNKEEALMSRVMLKSEQERVQYLQGANDSYAQTLKLLDDSMALRDSPPQLALAAAARDVHDYITYGLNTCLLLMQQNARRDAIRKLRAHYDALAEALADPAADADGLAAEAAEYRAAMWGYCYAQRSAHAGPAALKLEGVGGGFDELVSRHQLRLGHVSKGQEFEDLDDTQKLEVYNSIIAAESGLGGRAQVVPRVRRIIMAATTTWEQAVGFFLLVAGSLARDVVTDVEEAAAVPKEERLKVKDLAAGQRPMAAVWAAVTNALANICACSLAGEPRKVPVPHTSDLNFHTAVRPDGITALAYSIAHG